jgi:hypothetical protein
MGLLRKAKNKERHQGTKSPRCHKGLHFSKMILSETLVPWCLCGRKRLVRASSMLYFLKLTM